MLPPNRGSGHVSVLVQHTYFKYWTTSVLLTIQKSKHTMLGAAHSMCCNQPLIISLCSKWGEDPPAVIPTRHEGSTMSHKFRSGHLILKKKAFHSSQFAVCVQFVKAAVFEWNTSAYKPPFFLNYKKALRSKINRYYTKEPSNEQDKRQFRSFPLKKQFDILGNISFCSVVRLA